MRYACAAVVLFTLSCISIRQAAARIWTDKKGKEIEAELVEVKSGMAVLKLENGKTIKKALGTLSQEDQEFIKENAPAEDPAPLPKKPAKKKPTSKKPVPADPEAETPTEPDAKKPTVPAKGAKATTTSNGVTVALVGLSINKSLPEEPAAQQGIFMPMMIGGQSGTKFVLSVSDPERQIVSLDPGKSKITVCTDNVGTDLNKNDDGPFSAFAMLPLQLRAGNHFGVFELNQSPTPTPGAAQIHLQGELLVQCGVGEKTAEQADVPLKTAGQITVGPVPFDIAPRDKQGAAQLGSSFGLDGIEQKIAVTLKAKSSLDIIKKIVFLNSAGKEIPQSQVGFVNMISPKGPQDATHSERTIGLAEDVEKATVRIVSYEKLESISVPIDFEIGVGF